MLFYNDLDLNNRKILCLPSIFQFERKLGFWTTLLEMYDLFQKSHLEFKNVNFEKKYMLFYLPFDLNHQKTSQDRYQVNKISFSSLCEQDIKIAIWGRVLLYSWFYLLSKFASWVNFHPFLWMLQVSGVSIVLSGSWG